MSKPLQFPTLPASVFTKPAAALFLRIAEGWALCPSRRTLANVYRFGAPHHTNKVEATHYFFRDAVWEPSELWELLIVCSPPKTTRRKSKKN